MPVIVVWQENVLFNEYIAKALSETEKDVNKTLYLCIFFLAKGLIVDVKPLQLKHLWQIFLILRYYGQFKEFLQENVFFFVCFF